MKLVDSVKNDLKTDVTWNRVGRLGVKGAKAFPSASVQYVLDKVPIVGWLPRYNPRWILNDIIAGLTLGLMLIPQGLSYAKIATIPVQYGLMSSWLPSAIYAFMGTTKGEDCWSSCAHDLLHPHLKSMEEWAEAILNADSPPEQISPLDQRL